MKLLKVKISQIVVEGGIRKIFDEDSIDELVTSIKRHGILQPVVVQPRPDGTYALLIGERRFIAAKRAGLDVVPAIVMDEKLELGKNLEARLIENLHREGLDPLDEAEAYQQLIDMGYNVSEVTRRIGKSRYYVSKRLRLLRIHPKLREDVRRRTLTPGHVQALLRLEPEQQLDLAREVIEKGLSEKVTREMIRKILGKELSWRLIPIRLDLDEYRTLERIAPDGDVERFVKATIEMLLHEAKKLSSINLRIIISFFISLEISSCIFIRSRCKDKKPILSNCY